MQFPLTLTTKSSIRNLQCRRFSDVYPEGSTLPLPAERTTTRDIDPRELLVLDYDCEKALLRGDKALLWMERDGSQPQYPPDVYDVIETFKSIARKAGSVRVLYRMQPHNRGPIMNGGIPYLQHGVALMDSIRAGVAEGLTLCI